MPCAALTAALTSLPKASSLLPALQVLIVLTTTCVFRMCYSLLEGPWCTLLL